MKRSTCSSDIFKGQLGRGDDGDDMGREGGELDEVEEEEGRGEAARR